MQWYPHVTVAALVERDGKFLMVDEWADGRRVYNQPAGHLEDGESLIQAVERETLEETGRRFTPTAVVGIYLWRSPINSETFLRVNFCGEVSDRDHDLDLDSGIIDAVWLSREALAQDVKRVRSPLVFRCIDDYLAGQRQPLEMLQQLGDEAEFF